jgi:hypothetical protein
MIQPPLGLLTHLVALRSALDEPWAARATEPVVHRHSPTHVTLELLPYAVSEMWHAFTSFIALVRFAESITRPLLPIPLPPKVHIIVANRRAPIGTRNVFQPIPSIEDISAWVKQFAQAEAPHP